MYREATRAGPAPDAQSEGSRPHRTGRAVHAPGRRKARDPARGSGRASAGKAVAMYARVSTEDQAVRGYSLAAQRKRLRAFCGSQGWTVAGEYVEDGYSGRDVRRPAYQRMMHERDAWESILVLKIDRIHRNARNFMAMMDDLRRWGKDFVSATESLDTATATGRFVADMLQRIAQLESEQTGERVHMGMKQKAQEGGFNGMSAPFGYEVRRGGLVVNRREAPVVRQICTWRRQGQSLTQIAARLNTGRVRTKKGKAWTKRQVFRVVHNPLYRGALHWEDVVTPGTHPAIVAWTPRTRRGGTRGS